MENTTSKGPFDILISRLADEGKVGLTAAEALLAQAEKDPQKLASSADRIAKFMKHRDLNVRSAVARILGCIGSKVCLDALIECLRTEREEVLCTRCSYSCWSAEPLYFWIASGLSGSSKFFAEKTPASARALITVVCDSQISKKARAAAMKALSDFNFDDIGVDIPKKAIDIASEFAASDDPVVAEGGLSLLGKV
jgi:HEAT repeat protein